MLYYFIYKIVTDTPLALRDSPDTIVSIILISTDLNLKSHTWVP